MTYNVFGGTLSLTQSINHLLTDGCYSVVVVVVNLLHFHSLREFCSRCSFSQVSVSS